MAAEREHDMIEGYLDGTLPPESAREIERLAANDPELAAELKAEETIRGTFLRDVAALPSTATEPSGMLMAKLAVTPGAAGGAALLSTGVSTGVLGTIFGTGLGLTVVTIIGLIGLVLGAWLFAENAEERPIERETPTESVVETGASPLIVPVLPVPVPSDKIEGRNLRQSVERRPLRNRSSAKSQDVEENQVVAEAPENRDAATDAMIQRLQQAEEKKEPSIPTMQGTSSTITIEVDP